MNVFYNKEGIGDTLLVTLKFDHEGDKLHERRGNVVRIYDEKTNETLGYNIFHASNYFQISENNAIELNDAFVDTLNNVLKENGFQDKIEADLSPKFVVGFVRKKEKHPNADKLSVCQVDVGNEILQIVCGAPNVAEGQKVVVAKVGAVMPSGLVIKHAELRGVPSSGMICSARELELPNAPQEKGILVLEGDQYQIGEPFRF